MLLPVVNGRLMPTQLPVVEGGDYFDVSADVADQVHSAWIGVETAVGLSRTVFSIFGDQLAGEQITGELEASLRAAFENHPGFVRAKEAAAEHTDRRNEAANNGVIPDGGANAGRGGSNAP